MNVLNRVSCGMRKGVLTALVGPSGAGKSTLLGALSGIVRPDSGKVRVDGQAPSQLNSVWVPQGANALGSRTALENVLISPLSDGCSRPRAFAIATKRLSEVGLAGREESLAGQLSGGELQRLAFARALASSRSLLLADEPTANLDLESTRAVVKLMREISSSKTVVVATHDPEVVKSADVVLDLRRLNS